MNKYGLVNFNSLPEEPIVDKIYRDNIYIYKLFNICGTCIAKNKLKSTVYLLTIDGTVIPIKFNKEYFSLFDAQMFKRKADGKKEILEKSWFNRGNMLVIKGIRRGNEFVSKNYKSSPGHRLYHVDEILKNGDLILRSERIQGEQEEDERS